MGTPSGSYGGGFAGGRAGRPLPAGPVEFLEECARWWDWLERASPVALETFAATGWWWHPGPKPEPAILRPLGEEGPELVVFDRAHFYPLGGTFRPRQTLEASRGIEPDPPPREP